MTVNSAMLEAMQAEGLDLAACIRVVKAGEKRADPTAADRMAKMRAKRKGRSVTRNVTSEPLIEELHIPVSEAKASSPIWVCPEGVEPRHWADFRKARKAKRSIDSETAYEAVLRDLAKHSDDDWPPGRLVEHAAAKGWASINDPRKPMNGYGNGQQHRTNYGKNPTAIALSLLNT